MVLLCFPSQAQYDLWYERFITFNNSKVVEFLRKNAQFSQSANLVSDDNDLLRVSLIWTYRDKDAYEAYQKFHGQ